MATSPRRVSLAAEAVGYVGAVLILAGGAAAIRQQWHDWSEWTRIAAILAASIGFLAAGIATRRSDEPAMSRLRGVTWTISTAGIAATTAMIALWPLDMAGQSVALTTSAATTIYAAALWLVAPVALQQAAVFIAGLMFVNTVAVYAGDSAEGWIHALVSWVYGFVWAERGHARRIEPRWVAVSIGAATMLLAPATLQSEGARLGFGMAGAAAVMAASVAIRFTPSLIGSAVALFGFTTATVVRYFHDTLGVPAALSLTGVALLAIGALSARLLAAAHVDRVPRVADDAEHLRKVS